MSTGGVTVAGRSHGAYSDGGWALRVNAGKVRGQVSVTAVNR